MDRERLECISRISSRHGFVRVREVFSIVSTKPGWLRLSVALRTLGSHSPVTGCEHVKRKRPKIFRPSNLESTIPTVLYCRIDVGHDPHITQPSYFHRGRDQHCRLPCLDLSTGSWCGGEPRGRYRLARQHDNWIVNGAVAGFDELVSKWVTAPTML